jgi:capsular exopolysaccharide synthesis family protein
MDMNPLLNPADRERWPAQLDSPAAQDPEEARVPISQYVWILKRHRWKILGFCAAAVIATVIISARLTPIFESTTTVDVDRQTSPGVVGQEAAASVMNDADQFLATQMKLVQSDGVLRPVDDRLRLRQREGQASAGSEAGEAAPVSFKRLRVTRPPNTYLMLISYRSDDPQLAADAANAIAESYLQHSYDIRVRSSASLSTFMERQLDELKVKMDRSSLALTAFERELTVISPEEKTNILGSRLIQLNAERTSAQAERLRQQAAWESVESGSLEAALASPQGEGLRKLVEHFQETREHFADVGGYYGVNHPEYRRAQAQLDQVEGALEATRADTAQRVEAGFRESQRREEIAGEAVAQAKTEFDQVNARSVEYQAAKREADADKTLYAELVRKIKEAGINAGFQNSAIRIADAARPALRPVSPNIALNALLALLFSALVAVGAAVVGDVLDKTIKDPEQVARTLRVEVVGSLPLMKNVRGGRVLALPASSSERGLAEERDASGFHESVRTLRNSILLENLDQRYRSLLVTSAAPAEGKTTTAANLAAAHAEQGRRTLLIDGDLRRPSVHRSFNLPGVVGLANALRGDFHWRAAVIPVESLPDLHVLPAGAPSRHAADLIGRGLMEMIEEAAADYDLVVVDSPPLLGFAEPLQMATAVDGVLVVARAGQTTRKAVATVLATLNRVRAKTVGLVLNEVHRELSDSYYYYDCYRAYYRTPAAEHVERIPEKNAEKNGALR